MQNADQLKICEMVFPNFVNNISKGKHNKTILEGTVFFLLISHLSLTVMTFKTRVDVFHTSTRDASRVFLLQIC